MTSLQLSLSCMLALQRGDGAHVPLGPRDGALLAWLALEGLTPHARLGALHWPDSGAAASQSPRVPPTCV